jgi:uncharacterized protein YidB (DUF937 family)
VARGAFAGLPILAEDNFTDWDMQIVAYLTGSHDHVRVITPSGQSGGKVLAPLPVRLPTPTRRRKLTRPLQSGRSPSVLSLGVLWPPRGNSTARPSLSIGDLYSKICNYHQQRDASQRHEGWMQFLAVHKSATDSYLTYYRRIERAYDKIDRITPTGQSAEERAEELKLFTLLSNLPHDDSLRLSLTTQRDLTLADAASAMFRLDTSKKLAVSGVEQAHAAFGGNCWTCGDKDHVACECPHREAVQQLVARRRNAGNGNSGRTWKGKGKDAARNTTGDNARSSANVADMNNSANVNTTSADRARETAGVAALFLSNESRVADIWLCDSE